MNILEFEPRAQSAWFDANNLWLKLYDGRQLAIPLAYFPKLLQATEDIRNKFVISGGGIGLHWDDLDEDISVKGLVWGNHRNDIMSNPAPIARVG